MCHRTPSEIEYENKKDEWKILKYKADEYLRGDILFDCEIVNDDFEITGSCMYNDLEILYDKIEYLTNSSNEKFKNIHLDNQSLDATLEQISKEIDDIKLNIETFVESSKNEYKPVPTEESYPPPFGTAPIRPPPFGTPDFHQNPPFSPAAPNSNYGFTFSSGV